MKPRLLQKGRLMASLESALEQAYDIIVSNLGPSLSDNMVCAGVSTG